ncbi:hypothetical protein EYF80_044478 [Liparis tanakae]|uniref:Uncharacterized protein n=1 Tax=Liparis tanakae TaxID=230148 RepID=A0A4Z2FVT7_9TELE|nr:hypothetical protein EYF80_044478 [Liparis tanakae]
MGTDYTLLPSPGTLGEAHRVNDDMPSSNERSFPRHVIIHTCSEPWSLTVFLVLSDAQAELDSVEAELELVELQISDLLQKQTELTGRKDALLLRLQDVCVAAQPSSSKPPGAPPALSKQEMQLYDGTGQREDFSFTPYTTYFYMKLGRKAPLLKVQTHSIIMKMASGGTEAAVDTSANEEEEEEEEEEKEDEEEDGCDVTFDHVVVDHSCPPPPRQKVCKEQRNRSRKQLEEGRSFISPRRGIEVDVEIINIVDDGARRRAPPRPVKPCSKRKAATPQRARSRRRPASPAGSPSSASVLSETAAEELCDLREYYSQQLRRIDHASREQLGRPPPAERGVLACIREPLRSLGIGHTARSLWTRVSGRRRRLNR